MMVFFLFFLSKLVLTYHTILSLSLPLALPLSLALSVCLSVSLSLSLWTICVGLTNVRADFEKNLGKLNTIFLTFPTKQSFSRKHF